MDLVQYLEMRSAECYERAKRLAPKAHNAFFLRGQAAAYRDAAWLVKNGIRTLEESQKDVR